MTEERMQVFYFTFGVDHPLKNHAQPVMAPDYGAARLKMLDTYGKKWCSQLDEAADIAARMGVAR